MKLLDAAVAKAAAGGALGAPVGGASVSGAEGQFRKALAAFQGKRDGWSVERNKQVQASVLAEELVWSRPMLEDEGCDIDETPAGEEASLEDWCVFVHLLRERVTTMQEFVQGKEQSATFEDVMDDSFARKRHRSPSPPAAAKRRHVDPADPTGAGGATIALTPGRRGELAAEAVGLRTVTKEPLQQALMGNLSPESVPKPTELFEHYTREQQLRPVKAPRPWTDERNPRGGKDKNGKGGPVAGEGHEPEDGEEEDDVMSVADTFEFTPAEPGEGWTATMSTFAVAPAPPVEKNEPFRVPNYVGDEHMEAMEREIEKELLEARIFPADDRLPWGISALGMVEKLRNGKVKYRPVWDYSRPMDIGINARIELEKDKFSLVKDAYALLRPGYWMVKVDLDSAYRSVGVASQFWPAQCFEFGVVRYMDARAPFRNRALPGIFMRYTRANVAWMEAQGIPCVGYLNDFYMVAATREEAEEMMMLLVELVSFLGFRVNAAKCEGPEQLMEFLGVELSTSGGVCTAAISKDRVDFVVRTAKEGLLVAGGIGDAGSGAGDTAGAEDLDTIEEVICRYNGRKGRTVVVKIDDQCALRQALLQERKHYEEEALARSTRGAYSTGARAFVAFCIAFAGLGCLEPLLPASDNVLVVPLTHAGLVGGIKRLVKAAGLRPEAYAGHSLKRGGATMAKQLEVHTMYIKHQGDWRSDRYERYREMQPEQRLILPGAMAAAAATLT
ncbi:hypothetical protein CYMTET_17238 [Cymbomonas tetramitiformis]|uniref:Reverse transcriptase domain-containing protein n=1 Tax=Cymbomonas tetramitiformis TaxID=36881 RepID=A0AAE0GAP5_9CHLO|nr:hypothetical protein CYMTET_17238 [Cymbomonas tetramitiformis]